MADASQEPWPTEEEYLDSLTHERHMFAWTLVRYGGVPLEEAEARALACYPFEPPDDKCRGLIFHDEAWHWAMLAIRGPMYWVGDRGSEIASTEYRQEAERFQAACQGKRRRAEQGAVADGGGM